jgi:hypothetical protein
LVFPFHCQQSATTRRFNIGSTILNGKVLDCPFIANSGIQQEVGPFFRYNEQSMFLATPIIFGYIPEIQRSKNY